MILLIRTFYICFFSVLILSSCKGKEQTSAILKACSKAHSLSQIKHPVKPGEWRERYPEFQEPVKSYCFRRPTSATATRSVLYVMELGSFDEQGKKILEATRSYLSAFYQIPVARLSPADIHQIPARYTRSNTYGLQIRTSIILDSLLPSLLPDNGFALLAFTQYDLYPDEQWNFVFGQASLERRIGVWSLARLGNYNSDTLAYHACLMRTLHIAAHETGHMFGITHCIKYECCMNGSNSLSEGDEQPAWLCWECLSKICWNRKIMPDRHASALLNFHQKVSRDTLQQRYYSRLLQLLKHSSQ